MKKLLAIALSLCCILGCFSFTAGAYELTEDDICANLDVLASTYLNYAECYEGYFAEGEAPSARMLENYLVSNIPLTFPECLTDTYEDEYSYIEYYQVPAEFAEAYIGTVFTLTPQLLSVMRGLDIYVDGDEPYYNITVDYFGEVDYGDEPEYTEISFYGYEALENNEYMSYIYLIATGGYDYYTGEFVPYVPAPDAVEGVDYIYVLANEMDFDMDSMEICQFVSYVPAEIRGAIKSKTILDGETFTISSFEKITAEELRAANVTAVSEVSYNQLLTGLMLGAAVDIRRDTFENSYDTEVKVTTVLNETIYENVAENLGLTEEDSLMIVSINAQCGNKIVDPVKPVEISMMNMSMAGEDDSHYAIYRVSETGEAEVLESVSAIMSEDEDVILSICSAMVDSFGMFAVSTAPAAKGDIFDSAEKLDSISVNVSDAMIGDVDGDKAVDVKDSLTLKISCAEGKADTLNAENADINRDGKVQAKDLLALKRSLAGHNDGYNVGNSAVKCDGNSVVFTNTDNVDIFEVEIDAKPHGLKGEFYNYAVITYSCDTEMNLSVGANGKLVADEALVADGEYHSIIVDVSDVAADGIDVLDLAAEFSEGSLHINSVTYTGTYETALYEAYYRASRA